jgi:hypothetical protein
MKDALDAVNTLFEMGVTIYEASLLTSDRSTRGTSLLANERIQKRCSGGPFITVFPTLHKGFGHVG